MSRENLFYRGFYVKKSKFFTTTFVVGTDTGYIVTDPVYRASNNAKYDTYSEEEGIVLVDPANKFFVFAKKDETANSTDDKYMSQAYSFTHKTVTNVFVSKPYLHATDKVLIVDDFLADGEAVHALADLVHQAGGEVVGVGIAVEKGHQKGDRILR
jgi:hypothetical protein